MVKIKQSVEGNWLKIFVLEKDQVITMCAAMIICQSRVLLLFFKPGVQVFFIEPIGE